MSIVEKMRRKENFVSLFGALQEDIMMSEQVLKLSFSNEYKEYVSKLGAASFRGHELTGVCKPKSLNVVNATQQERENTDVPTDWYVVEQTHIDGIVFWQSTKGGIYKTQPGSHAKKVYGSLNEYIE